jgi:uncharacterized protein (TIGR02118 family)
MVKLVFLCRRRTELSHARYVELLLDGHVPIALRHHPTMRRYVVNIVDGAPPAAPELDSVGALWFDTLADYRERLYDSAEGERIVVRDVAGFMGGADGYLTREETSGDRLMPPTLGVRSSGAKVVMCVGRAPEARRAEFWRYWREQHVPAALRVPGVLGYTTNVVEERLSPRAPDYSLIAELHLDGPRETARARVIEELVGGGVSCDDYSVAEYIERW